MKVELSDAAEAELNEAFAFYHGREPGVADRFLDAIDEAVGRIAGNPTTYRLIDGEHRRCLAKVYPYDVVYRLQGDVIEIVAIAHQSREPGYWRQRET